MTEELRLMCILAHPDDESLGVGGILAKYSAEGVGTYLVTATRGERGWFGAPAENPGLTKLGQMREAELLCATQTLGVRDSQILNYIDGELDRAEPVEVIYNLVGALRRARPQVVVTFDPSGVYGHPDHVAISQFTLAAAICAADASYAHSEYPTPFRVAKLYYMMASQSLITQYQNVFGDLVMTIDGIERRPANVQDWMITSVVDTGPYWQQVWSAVCCHETQVGSLEALGTLTDDGHRNLWGTQEFTRVYSTVNGGRLVEQDLFEGLR
jgi:LmbE family N-acetylglucosaminyl deacetylase